MNLVSSPPQNQILDPRLVVVPYGFGAAESESGVSLPELALVWLLIVKNVFLWTSQGVFFI